MAVYECRGCGSLHHSNGKPAACECGGPHDDRPAWYRFDDAAELFD